MLYRPEKLSFKKVQKIGILILVQKWPFFQLFLGNRGQEYVFYDNLVRKNAFLSYMVLVQKWTFFQLFFLGNIGKGNDFYDILERKNAFLSYKNNNFKKSKN